MGRVCHGPSLYGPSLLWAEFVIGRVCYGPSCPVTGQKSSQNTISESNRGVGTVGEYASVVGSIPGRVIPKTLKMVPVATLLGAQHYEASTGFSSPKTIVNMITPIQ